MRKVAIGIALLIAVSAFAQERRMQSFTERYGAELGLTDTQKTTIDGIEKKWNEDHEKFISEFRATMAEYRAAREANDQAKLDALKPKMDAQRAEMTKLRVEQEDKIAATFTDDQKAKWSKIKEERDARMKAREQH